MRATCPGFRQPYGYVIPGKLRFHAFHLEKIEEITAMSQERVLALYAPALNKFTEEAFVAKFQTILQAASGKSLSTVKASSSGETT